jgi:small subunit ribosomal protein S16
MAVRSEAGEFILRGFAAGRLGGVSTVRELHASAFRVVSPRGAVRNESRFSMVVIRLSRGGAKKRPFFNIVVADSRVRRDGRFIERVGFYNPVAAGGEQPLRVAFDRIEHWTKHGAQLSPTVERLVAQAKAAA